MMITIIKQISKNRLLGFGALALLIGFSACKSNSAIYKAPKVNAFRGGKLPAPPGMVYVPSGTILFKGSLDSGNVEMCIRDRYREELLKISADKSGM